MNNKEKEGLKRLNKLEVLDEVKENYKEGRIAVSERLNKIFNAVLRDTTEEEKKIIEDYEKRSGNKVYHAIKTYTEFGEILDLLIVSNYEEDWEYEFDEEDENYYVMSMAMNLTNEDFSEMGSIVVRKAMGGLERIG